MKEYNVMYCSPSDKLKLLLTVSLEVMAVIGLVSDLLIYLLVSICQSSTYLPTYLPISVHAKLLQSCPTLCDPMDYIACQAPLSMGFSRQEYWSGLPCPPPGNLPNPGIKLWSPTSFALARRFFN